MVNYITEFETEWCGVMEIKGIYVLFISNVPVQYQWPKSSIPKTIAVQWKSMHAVRILGMMHKALSNCRKSSNSAVVYFGLL